MKFPKSSSPYDRNRLEREFNAMGEQDAIVSYDPQLGGIISQVGSIVLYELELGSSDILLDLGTGQGRWAMPAAQECQSVYGLDISDSMLSIAKQKASEAMFHNLQFLKGSFEELPDRPDLRSLGINKIMTIYAMHHLTDPMKAEAIAAMVHLVRAAPNPNKKIVIGDIMWFEDPQIHRDQWDLVYYDEGDTDFPAQGDQFLDWFRPYSNHVRLIPIHPLVGVVVAEIKSKTMV